MYVKSCPVCGKFPKIQECVRLKYRRRMCATTCWHPRLSIEILKKYDCVEINRNYYGCDDSFFIVTGDCDDNKIYKIWNEALIDE